MEKKPGTQGGEGAYFFYFFDNLNFWGASAATQITALSHLLQGVHHLKNQTTDLEVHSENLSIRPNYWGNSGCERQYYHLRLCKYDKKIQLQHTRNQFTTISWCYQNFTPSSTDPDIYKPLHIQFFACYTSFSLHIILYSLYQYTRCSHYHYTAAVTDTQFGTII